MEVDFTPKCPNIYVLSNEISVSDGQTFDISVNWTSAAPGIELVVQDGGLGLNGRSSRLCKQFLFEQFLKLTKLMDVNVGSKYTDL